MREGEVFAKQILMLTYTIIYIRFVRDKSILNGILPLLLISLAKFANNVEYTYFDVETPQDTELTLKELLGKTLHVLHLLIIFQSIYTILYHSFLNLETDVCRYNYGYLFTDLLGEFDCERRGRTMLFVLDFVLLTCELQVTTDCLTRLKNGNHVKIELLPVERYGIFSILRAKTTGLNATEWELTVYSPLRRLGRDLSSSRTIGEIDYGSVR
ncbi:HFR071Cp [Eremothecium sinecaudum]|uniref:HFR071Cp n=1 Tax=Eremothecium sinecaudum TaxID=45286 RepID=A0A0X8HU85_9SACH|nr:HFR071Cp [Eremothecium sinecaudum]AMD21926.1 HFR071Cp [Eremothecium sinecaudum]